MNADRIASGVIIISAALFGIVWYLRQPRERRRALRQSLQGEYF